jgi:hypothetical protein
MSAPAAAQGIEAEIPQAPEGSRGIEADSPVRRGRTSGLSAPDAPRLFSGKPAIFDTARGRPEKRDSAGPRISGPPRLLKFHPALQGGRIIKFLSLRPYPYQGFIGRFYPPSNHERVFIDRFVKSKLA